MKSNITRATELKILKSNITEQRRLKGLKVKDVCKRMGKTRYYFSQLRNPSIRTIVDIAHSIGCEPSVLLKGL